MNIRNLIGIAAIAVALVAGGTYAFSEEAPAKVCLAQISKLPDGLKVVEIAPEEQSAIIAKKGPPPAEGTFATVQTDEAGAFIIHDGDCVTYISGQPVPLETLNKFLGRVNG